MKKINGEEFIYHRFICKTEIQEFTFIGNEFIGMDLESDDNENILNRVKDAGNQGFLPDLLNELKELIGKENCEYDGYEISKEEFSQYFFIKASEYKNILGKVEKWKEFSGYENLIYWNEKET